MSFKSPQIWVLKSIVIYTTIGIDGCSLGLDNTSIRAKPYILQKICFQGLCSKFLGFWHGHGYFWPLRSYRLLEAKNTPRRPKKAWGVDILKKVFNKSCSATSKTPWQIQSDLSYDLRVKRYHKEATDLFYLQEVIAASNERAHLLLFTRKSWVIWVFRNW